MIRRVSFMFFLFVYSYSCMFYVLAEAEPTGRRPDMGNPRASTCDDVAQAAAQPKVM
jgi:hypothetical protein